MEGKWLPHFIISVVILLTMPEWLGAIRPRYEQRVAHGHMTSSSSDDAFVTTSGHQFWLGGKALYVNGANIYWLMSMASRNEESSKASVTEVLTEAASVGVTVVRIWAFADGTDYLPLQLTPGVFDETVFQVFCNVSSSPPLPTKQT